ncbi:MAG: lysylphosphatidylglycerol synthase transmembrane domain-containing protein [Bacteroidota bacterium]
MEEKPRSVLQSVKILKLLLKIAVTIVCLWYVSSKINFTELGQVLVNTNWLFLAVAVGVFILSKIIASYRLNIYFKNISLFLKEKENLKLFWLGMFYNLFLPGSVTGDAYKVIVLSKQFNISYRKTTTAVLLDRFSGLLGLGLILALYSFFTLDNKVYIALLVIAALASVFILYFIVRRYFTDFLPGFWPTFFLGLAVQSLMVICIYAIIYALHIQNGQTEYVFIFLIASVAGVLPLTIGGGLGIREFVFYKGAIYFGLNEHTAIIISLLFYCVTLFTSLFGAIFIFKKIFPVNPSTK